MGPVVPFVPYILMAASTVVSMQGAAQQGRAAAAQGKAEQQLRDYESAQLSHQAVQEQALAQRAAINVRRKADLAQSRLQAVAAASGASASDPTIIDLAQDIEGQGEYDVATALYNGDERAYNLQMGSALKQYQGQVARMSGTAAQSMAQTKMASALLDGAQSATSFYGKYGFDWGNTAGKAAAPTTGAPPFLTDADFLDGY